MQDISFFAVLLANVDETQPGTKSVVLLVLQDPSFQETHGQLTRPSKEAYMKHSKSDDRAGGSAT